MRKSILSRRQLCSMGTAEGMGIHMLGALDVSTMLGRVRRRRTWQEVSMERDGEREEEASPMRGITTVKDTQK